MWTEHQKGLLTSRNSTKPSLSCTLPSRAALTSVPVSNDAGLQALVDVVLVKRSAVAGQLAYVGGLFG